MDYNDELGGNGKGRGSLGTLAVSVSPAVLGLAAYGYFGSPLGPALVFAGVITTCYLGNNISKVHDYKTRISSYF